METFASLIVFALLLLSSSLKFIIQHERYVVFRFGRYKEVKGPGPAFVIPIIETFKKVDMRTVPVNIPTQEVLAYDRRRVMIDMTCFLQVVDPEKVVIEVADPYEATEQVLQASLRKLCAMRKSGEILDNQDAISADLVKILDGHTQQWGINTKEIAFKKVEVLPAQIAEKPVEKAIPAQPVQTPTSAAFNQTSTPQHAVSGLASTPQAVQAALASAPKPLSASPPQNTNTSSAPATAFAAVNAVPQSAASAKTAPPPTTAEHRRPNAAGIPAPSPVNSQPAVSTRSPLEAIDAVVGKSDYKPGESIVDVISQSLRNTLDAAAERRAQEEKAAASPSNLSQSMTNFLYGDSDSASPAQTQIAEKPQGVAVPEFVNLQLDFGNNDFDLFMASLAAGDPDKAAAKTPEPTSASGSPKESAPSAVPEALRPALTGTGTEKTCSKCEKPLEGGLLCFNCWEMN